MSDCSLQIFHTNSSSQQAQYQVFDVWTGAVTREGELGHHDPTSRLHIRSPLEAAIPDRQLPKRAKKMFWCFAVVVLMKIDVKFRRVLSLPCETFPTD